MVESWKFKPTAPVKLNETEDLSAFVSAFLNYLNCNDDAKSKVKKHFDETFEADRKPQQFFPMTIIKRCILECTDQSELCTLISLGQPPLQMDNVRKLSAFERSVESFLMEPKYKYLYRELCSRLDIRVAVGFSLMSPEPIVPPPLPESKASSVPQGEVGNAEPAAQRFIGRVGGEREGINTGLLEDRKSFIDFMNQQPYGWYSQIFDLQKNVDLPQGNMKSDQQLISLFRGASLVNLPMGSEVIVYFAGHGEVDTGNWGAYTENDEEKTVLSLYVTMENILDAWIEMENQKADPEDHLQLTIISDCCFSNKWVERLSKCMKSPDSKYGSYPICIQGAASCDAYENTLLPLLIQNKTPLCAGQDPEYVHTQKYKEPAIFKDKLTNVKDYKALFSSGAVPSRRVLVEASGQVKKDCEAVIECWDMDGAEDKGDKYGTLVESGRARIDLQISTPNFRNLQVQYGNQSYAQIFIHSTFRPGKETIKKFLKKSLEKTKVFWLYVNEQSLPTCSEPNEPPKKNSVYPILLLPSEDQKVKCNELLNSIEWNVSKIKEMMKCGRSSQTTSVPAIVYAKKCNGGQKFHDFQLMMHVVQKLYPVARVLVESERPWDLHDCIKSCFLDSLATEELHWIWSGGADICVHIGSSPPPPLDQKQLQPPPTQKTGEKIIYIVLPVLQMLNSVLIVNHMYMCIVN